jgi:hypothetical protein
MPYRRLVVKGYLPHTVWLWKAVEKGRCPEFVSYPSTSRIKVKSKINLKGNGQECPFHMGVAALR